jgi:anti-sigma factor RsiW
MSTENTETAVSRYFDGEMTPEEQRAFDARLESDTELQAELSAMRITSELVQAQTQEHVAQASFDGFFERISAEVPMTAMAAEPAPTPAAQAQPPASLGAKLKAWWSRNWTPVLIGAAAAAAVAFFVMRDDGTAAADGEAPMVAESGEVTVDEVNNDGPTTVLISMPADDDDSTVIWLLDEEDDEATDDGALDEEDPI